MSDNSAEYNYYSKTLNPSGRTEVDENVNLDEWANILDVQQVFSPGGRYSIVTESLGGKPKVNDLLEIGCGAGVNVAWMHRFAEKCSGADIYLAPHLKVEREDSYSFLEFNANHRFPIGTEAFDVVVAMMIMEHVFDPFHFCSEVARILKPNGLFFLNVPLITALKHRASLMLGRLPVTSKSEWFESRAWDGNHLHYFTLPLLKRLLTLYGLKVELVRGVGTGHQIKSLLPTLLAPEISIRARKHDTPYTSLSI